MAPKESTTGGIGLRLLSVSRGIRVPRALQRARDSRAASLELGNSELALARWKLAVVTVGAVGVLASANAMASPEALRFRQGVVIAWVCALFLLLAAGVLLYLRWRMSHEAPASWLATTALCGAAYLGSYVARGFTSKPTDEFVDGRGLDLLMFVVLLLLVRQAARAAAPPRLGPFGLALVCAGAGVLLQWLVLELGPFVPSTAVGEVLASTGIGVMGLLSVVWLLTSRELGTSIREQLALACALTALGRIVTPADPFEPTLRSAVGLGLTVCAAAVYSREALFLLLRGRAQAQAVATLRRPPAYSSADSPGAAHDEQMHELRASLAGVASAVHLLARDDAYLTEERRWRLTGMLEAEVGRLERLITHTELSDIRELPVDELLEPLVTSRRLVGQEIDWQPSGCRVLAAPDPIVEAVNILLVNAATHAPGSPVRISTVREGGLVRLRISDEGPGVPSSVRGSLFAKGVRGESSGGQGIGLNLAHRLLAAQGGNLQLADPEPRGGATFELTLRQPVGVPG